MDFTETINNTLRERGITPSDLARMTGYSVQYIHELLSDGRTRRKKRWNETTMNKVCAALGLHLQVHVATGSER